MISQAQQIEQENTCLTRSGAEFISSLTECDIHYTREFIKNPLRYFWCSRVGLVERKATMKCVECNVGFCCDSSGKNCWVLHVAHGDVPAQQKRGTKRLKVAETHGS